MKIKCEIFRGVPNHEKRDNFATYIVEAEPNDMVLDVLESIYQQHDPTLAYRFACGVARCGECAMVINGEPCMACDRMVEPELRIEPLRHLPIIKDTVIDRRRVFDHIHRMLPPAEDIKDLPACLMKLDKATAHTKIENSIRLTTCFECLICQSCCPRYLSNSDNFPGPLGLLMLAQMMENPAQKHIDESQVSMLTASCIRCGKCSKHCPASKNPLGFALKLLNCKPAKAVRVSSCGDKGIYVQEVWPNE